MPIQFPQPARGNPFDRWQWQRGAKCPQQQVQPNLAVIGAPLSSKALHPGIGRGARKAVNLRNLGTMYQHGGGAPGVNPASDLTSPSRVRDSATVRTFRRVLGKLNMALGPWVTRDSTGAVLASCRVMVFRTEDMSFVGETASDASGVWSMPMLKGGPFFIVEYKTGAPDRAGTSQNTIVPSEA